MSTYSNGGTQHQNWEKPHALYRVFAADGTLLYVGCSYHICQRLAAHSSTKVWVHEIATIKVTWYNNEITGRRAEAAAILSEGPKYNRMKPEPDAVGMGAQPRPGRGDGIHCPKCGKEIEGRRPGKAYCNACAREYRQRRRLQQKVDMPG